MTSNLSAFPYFQEREEATPAAFNTRLSIVSANIAAVGSQLTISPPSGNTVSISTNLEVVGGAHFQYLSVGSTPPSYLTTAAVTIEVNSAFSDYLYMVDSSAQKSSYIIGSRAGGLADGLNIWDASAGTMIASFSKQSIRFFQNVVGPVFDIGGALASTYNAATFSGSTTTVQIQAAISQASIDGVKRVYVPASMYPYDPRKISFDTRVQMVREGGAWDVYDVQAYGARPDLSVANAWSTTAIQAAIHGANGFGGGVVYVPTGSYGISSITIPRKVVLRGSGGGRHLDATTVSLLYQNDSTVTTIIFLRDQGGSGAIVEELQIQAASATNGGGIRIAGMTFCQLRSVGISGTSGFAIQIEGGNDANMNVIQDCSITMTSMGTAIDVEGGPSGMDTTPYMTGCYVSCDAPAAWISIKSTTSGVAPDSPLFTNNRFINSSSTVTAIYGLMTNARFIANRFESVAGGINVTLAPPAGSQSAGEFIANTYGITGGALTWTDSLTLPSTRFQEITPNGVINSVPGSAILPSFAFGSENSLGFFRSAVSTIGLSYGALAYPTGSAVTPSFTFSSETSLGWYRSGVSSMALSYGSLRLPLNSEFVIIGAGGTPIPFRMFESGGDMYLTANRTRAFTQDNTAAASWMLHLGTNVGTSDLVDLSHTSANGASNVRFSLTSTGEVWLADGIGNAPAYAYQSDKSLGLYRSGVQTIAQSLGTLNLATNAVRLSMRTLAASSVTASAANTNVAVNEVVVTVQASGASFAVNSGGTTWIFSSVASAKNT